MSLPHWTIESLSVGLVLVAIFTGSTLAANEEKGRVVAERYCLKCHTSSNQESNQVAPALTSFKEKWPLSHLEEALAEGILTGHDNSMPVFTFSPGEIEDLLAYIESLPN